MDMDSFQEKFRPDKAQGGFIRSPFKKTLYVTIR